MCLECGVSVSGVWCECVWSGVYVCLECSVSVSGEWCMCVWSVV